MSTPSPSAPEVAIILARPDGDRTTLRQSVAGFAAEAGDRGEVIVVDASGDVERSSTVRVLRRPPGRLVPELWSQGLDATTAPLVALTTAGMVPRPGWLKALRDAIIATDADGVGGPIAPGNGLSATDRAIYLMRHARYWPPIPDRAGIDPPGDNALYRRDRLTEVANLWRGGFWEVEVHRGLRALGGTLALAPGAVVEYRGGSRLPSSVVQRAAHARRYGAGRALGWGWPERLSRSAGSAVVPAVLLGRIIAALRLRGEPLGPWLPALPAATLLLSCWSLGEAAGALLGPSRWRREAA